jgi:pimeloyl-ACP methyl ester carboxylesterase
MTKPTSETITVAGRRTQLTRGGSGPPLLYLHSAGGETEWMPFHELLARHFTVYLPAHPGFAASTGLEEMREVTDFAWHYVDLLTQLNLGPVPVVGLSLLRPNLVQKLVMVNAAGLYVPGSPMAELFTDDLEEIRRLCFHDRQSPGVDLAIPKSLEDARILNWLRASEATARVAWNPYLHNPKLPKHLRRIECPTLVLWGRHDKLIPLAHGEFYAANIPGAKLEIIENCGHMPPFEKPEKFVERVVSFCGYKP